MKFREPGDAAEFTEVYNGKQFNSMEVRIAVALLLSPGLTKPLN